MKSVRTVVFWAHLSCGLVAGVIILIMSVTGALLAFQPQILAYLEREVRVVATDTNSTRLPAQELARAALAARPGAQINSVAFESDPARSVMVGMSGNAIVFVD